MNNKPISIVINTADYTPTELMQEIQRMRFQDPRINELLVATLRKMADAIEKKEIGFTKIKTVVDHRFDQLPECVLTLAFHDQEQYKKGNYIPRNTGLGIPLKLSDTACYDGGSLSVGGGR